MNWRPGWTLRAAVDEAHFVADRRWHRRPPNWREAGLQLYLATGDTARALHHWRRCLQAIFNPSHLGRGL